jgi:hypothetical protein
MCSDKSFMRHKTDHDQKPCPEIKTPSFETVYVPAGLFHSWAHVKPVDQPARKYRYFGAFLGLGVECTLNARWSVFADLLGFLRGRTDQRSVNEPEYVDLETGNVTNSSGGGLLRVGGAFYF